MAYELPGEAANYDENKATVDLNKIRGITIVNNLSERDAIKADFRKISHIVAIAGDNIYQYKGSDLTAIEWENSDNWHISSPDSFDDITFNLNSESVIGPGVLKWNTEEGVLEVGLTGGIVALQLGQETLLPRSINGSGVSLANGDVVYVSSAVGNKPVVDMTNNLEANSSLAIAVATESIADGGQGYFTTFGLVRGLNTLGCSAGKKIYLSSADGKMTDVLPSYPSTIIEIGHCILSDETKGVILVNINNRYSSKIDEISKTATGFPNLTESSISWNPVTREISVSPNSDVFRTYYYSKEAIHDDAITAILPDVTDNYFFYLDENEVAVISSTPWDLLKSVPIAFIYYNADKGDGIVLEERHGADRNLEAHKEFHHVIGTYYLSGLAISNYDLLPSTPSDAGNQFDIGLGAISDEDLESQISAFTGGVDNYYVYHRAGAEGVWTWDTSLLPFLSGTYAYYNENTGASFQLTELNNNSWFNIWLFAIPSIDGSKQGAVFIGQQEYGNLVGATTAAFTDDIETGTFPFSEAAQMYRITLRTASQYGNTGKCRIENVTDFRGSNSLTQVLSPVSQLHNALGGRGDANAHPAEALSKDNNLNDLTSDNVGGSIDELANAYLRPRLDISELSAIPQSILVDKCRSYVQSENTDYFYNSGAVSGDIAPDDQLGGVGFWSKSDLIYINNPLSIFVDGTTGNDANSGSELAPYFTFNRALEDITNKRVRADVTITLANQLVYDYESISLLSGVKIENNYPFLIKSEMSFLIGDFTITATANPCIYNVTPGASGFDGTADAYRGKFLKDASGDYYPILKSGATSLTVNAGISTGFQIYETSATLDCTSVSKNEFDLFMVTSGDLEYDGITFNNNFSVIGQNASIVPDFRNCVFSNRVKFGGQKINLRNVFLSSGVEAVNADIVINNCAVAYQYSKLTRSRFVVRGLILEERIDLYDSKLELNGQSSLQDKDTVFHSSSTLNGFFLNNSTIAEILEIRYISPEAVNLTGSLIYEQGYAKVFMSNFVSNLADAEIYSGTRIRPQDGVLIMLNEDNSSYIEYTQAEKDKLASLGLASSYLIEIAENPTYYSDGSLNIIKYEYAGDPTKFYEERYEYTAGVATKIEIKDDVADVWIQKTNIFNGSGQLIKPTIATITAWTIT